MNDDKDETVDNITTEEKIDNVLDSSLEESEKRLEERAKGLAETAKNIGKFLPTLIVLLIDSSWRNTMKQI